MCCRFRQLISQDYCHCVGYLVCHGLYFYSLQMTLLPTGIDQSIPAQDAKSHRCDVGGV